MQIIAGRYKGLTLATPAGLHTRPTLSRIRESLFNILGYPLSGSFLELYAGAGSVGLEAYSRGCDAVVMVENHRHALNCLKSNINKLKAPQGTIQVMDMDALAFARQQAGRQRFDYIFLDPPYEQAVFDQWVPAGLLDGLLASGGQVVVQHNRNINLAPTWSGLDRQRQRPYGVTVLSFYQLS